MEKKTRDNIIYLSKFLIPLIIVICLFLGGVSAGIITFEKTNKTINTGEISATILINFGDGINYSKVMTIQNSTVFDFLLEVNKTKDITVEYSYDQQLAGNKIDSITYRGKKYIPGEDGHWWLFYVNSQFASAGADMVYVNNNDLIEWRYEKF